mgnify:CR=1 FL=1
MLLLIGLLISTPSDGTTLHSPKLLIHSSAINGICSKQNNDSILNIVGDPSITIIVISSMLVPHSFSLFKQQYSQTRK